MTVTLAGTEESFSSYLVAVTTTSSNVVIGFLSVVSSPAWTAPDKTEKPKIIKHSNDLFIYSTSSPEIKIGSRSGEKNPRTELIDPGMSLFYPQDLWVTLVRVGFSQFFRQVF
jgi:hypothetical protein